MRIGKFQKCLLFFSLICLNVVMLMYLESSVQKRNYFSYEKGMEHFVNFNVPVEVLEQFYADSGRDMSQFLSLLTI